MNAAGRAESELRHWIARTAILHVVVTAGFLIFFLKIVPRLLKVLRDFEVELSDGAIFAIQLDMLIVNQWYWAIVLVPLELGLLWLCRPALPRLATSLSWLFVLTVAIVIAFSTIALMKPMLALRHQVGWVERSDDPR